jgi:hypothetical protein
MRHASLLWAHESLNTTIDLVYDPANFFTSSEHLLPSNSVYNYMDKLPPLLTGPAKTPKGDPTAHLYLTAGGQSRLLGKSQLNAMTREKISEVWTRTERWSVCHELW